MPPESAAARYEVRPAQTIREVMARIDANGSGIALVADDEGRLIDTITDGDLRRAMLRGLSLETTAGELVRQKSRTVSVAPITAPVDTSDADVLALMRRHCIRHVPLVDADGRVARVAAMTDLAGRFERPLRAMVMAGGYGKRLLPLTDELPKPMLPVGDKPLLEHIIMRLRQAGIHQVKVATHYKSDLIARHFGDGRELSVNIEYLHEDEPLGTAGALGLLNPSPEPILVVNGDVLTRLDYGAMADFHRENAADMTVAVRPYEIAVPFGVVETDGAAVTGINEKPLLKGFVNAGVYLLNADVVRLVPPRQRYDMTDLIVRLLEERRPVISFPIHEYWIDIGRSADYDRASADLRNGSV